MKKILALVAALSVVMSVVAGGSIAYLTDTKSAKNTMTMGKVEIKQIEQERDENGALVDFTQSKPLYPAVFEGSSIPWAAESEWVEAGEQAWKVVANNDNVVDKFVTVKNTGKSEAYVRTIIAYEGDETYGPEGAYIHVVHNGSNVTPAITVDCINTVEISGVKYTVYTYTYPEALAAGATSIPSLKQIYMNKAADNDVVAKYGDTYDILVLSQAVQTAGFDDAKTALDTAFGDVTNETAAEWFGAVDKENKKVVVSSKEDLAKVLTTDETTNTTTLTNDVIAKDIPVIQNYTSTESYTFDGNGNTITMDSSADIIDTPWTEGGSVAPTSNIFASANGSMVTVKDLTINGTMQSVSFGKYTPGVTHNTTANKVNIVDAKVVSYSSGYVGTEGISPALTIYGNTVLNNCNVYGTTLSELDTAPMYPVYDVAVVNDTTTTVNGGKYGSMYTWAKINMTIKDAEVDTIYAHCTNGNYQGIVLEAGTTVNKICTENAMAATTTITKAPKLTIKAGATVNTLDLSNITSNKDRIVIEDGATVHNIVVNGETVDFETWKNS